jgi:Sec-independent protein translocase protein TatA
MSETIYLVGAEDVRSAGRSIATAADGMKRAADTLDESLRSHQRFLDDWLTRFQTILADWRPA